MFCPKCKALMFPEEGKLRCRRCDEVVDPADIENAQQVTQEGADKAARQYARANGYTHYLICQT